jgi:MFS family permease
MAPHTPPRSEAPRGIRGAPRSLAIAAVTLAFQNGIAMAFAVLYLPLIGEFGGTRAEVATVHSAVLLLGGFSAPLIGWAFDRLGPRRLFQWGAVVAAVGFVAGSQARSLPELVMTYGIVGGLGLAALGSQANMVVAALWFPGARGRAIAIADLGTGVGAFVFVQVGQAVVTTLGWRTTLLVWAAVLVAVVIPLNAFQRLPERLAARPSETPSRAAWTVRDATRSAPFWWLALSRFFGACAFPLMNTHLVAYAIGHGISAAHAATALGAVSLVSLAGRLNAGWLCDRIGRAETLTVTYGSAALAVACLSLLGVTGSPVWLVAYVAFYGMAQGSSGIVGSARAADVFAGRTFGAVYGWLSLSVGPGEAIGAWLGGLIFDATGSYLPAFAFVVACLAAGVFSMWRVRGGHVAVPGPTAK